MGGHGWRRHEEPQQTVKWTNWVIRSCSKPMTKYSKTNKLDVRWQYGFFMGVSTRTNEVDQTETSERGRSEDDRRTSDGMQTQHFA